MRILLSIILSLLLAFFLTELFCQIFKSIPKIGKIKSFNYSFFGLILFLGGLIYTFLPNVPLNTLAGTALIGSGLGIILHHLMKNSYLFFEQFEYEFIKKHEKGVERLLEIFPGALTWVALTSPLWLAFTLPFAVAYIILIADIYWLFNACKIGLLIFIGYRKMKYAISQNWTLRLKKDYPKEWGNYYHLLVLPTYNENLEVISPAFEAIAKSDYPKNKIFLGVGFEERQQKKNPQEMEEKIKEVAKYQNRIGGVFHTIHPIDLPGEIPGPASNRNWIINNAAKQFEKLGIKPENVIVTTLDADFVIHQQFLSGMLYKYLSIPEKERMKRSLTGVFLYNNNYWQSPAPMRLVASGTAYWQLSEMVGSDKYINFSSLSMNLSSLLSVGLWIPDKVNDDSGFYWKAYFHYNGDYKVLPHFMPISADAVLDVSLLKSFENQYLQLKRWAYGVEHMPFIIKSYFTKRDMDFWDKTDKLLFITWSYMKWGTLAFFITFAATIIPLINQNYAQSVVAFNQPVISSWILTFAFVGLFSTIYAHEKTVPKRPANWNVFQRIWSFVQWALIPLVLVTIASVPAIDAQTRLMLGKYMEFRTTVKARTTES